MAAAHEITDLLRLRYGDRLLAVMLMGSTVKGTDRPVSDVDLSAILTECEDRWYPFLRGGMYVGVSYGKLADEIEAAGKVDYQWPVTGDWLRRGVALYDPDGLYGRLRELQLAAEAATDFGGLIAYALADMYEYVLKLFALDPAETAPALIYAGGAAYWAALAVGLANRHQYLSARSMFEESYGLTSLPQGYREGIEALLSPRVDVASLQAALSLLWPAFVKWARELGADLADEGAAL